MTRRAVLAMLLLLAAPLARAQADDPISVRAYDATTGAALKVTVTT